MSTQTITYTVAVSPTQTLTYTAAVSLSTQTLAYTVAVSLSTQTPPSVAVSLSTKPRAYSVSLSTQTLAYSVAVALSHKPSPTVSLSLCPHKASPTVSLSPCPHKPSPTVSLSLYPHKASPTVSLSPCLNQQARGPFREQVLRADEHRTILERVGQRSNTIVLILLKYYSLQTRRRCGSVCFDNNSQGLGRLRNIMVQPITFRQQGIKGYR